MATIFNTTFDDSATHSIATALSDAPFTGRFRSEQPLSTLLGEDPNGVWTLEISDDAADDAGTLLDWTLSFITPKMVVIDTLEPNTPFLDLLDDTGRSDNDNITQDNTPLRHDDVLRPEHRAGTTFVHGQSKVSHLRPLREQRGSFALRLGPRLGLVERSV